MKTPVVESPVIDLRKKNPWGTAIMALFLDEGPLEGSGGMAGMAGDPRPIHETMRLFANKGEY